MSEQILRENQKQYDLLIQEFITQNSKINLSSFNDYETILNKHIKDSLQIFNLKQFHDLYLDRNKPQSIADIGTGGGFPGLALAIALPHCQFYLIESIRKKCLAIDEMCKALEIKNVETINKRVEELNQKFDITMSRAVARFDEIFSWSKHITRPSGSMYLYKSTQENISGYIQKTEYVIEDSPRIIYLFQN